MSDSSTTPVAVPTVAPEDTLLVSMPIDFQERVERLLQRPVEFEQPNRIRMTLDEIARAKTLNVGWGVTLWSYITVDGARILGPEFLAAAAEADELVLREDFAAISRKLLTAKPDVAKNELLDDHVLSVVIGALHQESDRRLPEADCLALATVLKRYDWLQSEAPDIWCAVQAICSSQPV